MRERQPGACLCTLRTWRSHCKGAGMSDAAEIQTPTSDGHTFHIPVMGTGFTIDTPIRIAPYGIHSAISLVNDSLIEIARRRHAVQTGRAFELIPDNHPDARAERIRSYLDLVQELVDEKTEKLRSGSFEEDQGPSRYFELLPTTSKHRQRYLALKNERAPEAQRQLDELRQYVVPGRVDVNIMTKLDRAHDAKGRPVPEKHSEALSALRGFMLSKARGAVILSAGANPRLFAYLGEWEALFPREDGGFDKPLILKVSDFRSAFVQAKMLARRGIWVSEYRIESGLNCGGHAFPTEGHLLGPILDEFKARRSELQEGLHPAWLKGLAAGGRAEPSVLPKSSITVQGGIGTHDEDCLLREHYGADATGWGSPFLMVPEVVQLDSATERLLATANEDDVMLSYSSPLGVRFWTVRGSPSEQARLDRIAQGIPGSVCRKRHLAMDCTYGDVPLCTGSRAFQRKKLAELDPKDEHHALLVERITAPACICDDLGGAFQRADAEDDELLQTPPSAICPGPNVVNFQRAMTLDEMVDHVYGRKNVLTRSGRPHFLLREAQLYLDVAEQDLSMVGTPLESRKPAQLDKYLDRVIEALGQYRKTFVAGGVSSRWCSEEAERFASLLGELEQRAQRIKARLTTGERGLRPLHPTDKSALPTTKAGAVG